MQLCFHRPLETTRMVLGGIAAHNQHHVGVLDVDPAVSHRAASEGGPQTGDRRTVSNTGLRFEIADPQAAHGLDGEKIQFVRVSGSTNPTNRFQAIDRVAVLVFVDEGCVTRLLGPASNFVDCLIPGNVFPITCSRPSYLRLQQTTIVDDILFERCAFGTECPAIDWMIGIALDVHDLRNRVLCFVTQRVNDYATTHRAIRTSTARLRGPCDLQALRLRVNRRQAESEYTNACASNQGRPDEGSS